MTTKKEHPEAYTSISQQFDIDVFMQNYPSEDEARRIAKEIKSVLRENDVFIELGLLKMLRISEIQNFLKNCFGMQGLGRRV